MNVQGLGKIYYNNNVTFQRRLRPEEEYDYHQTIMEAERNLGVDNVAMIIHGTCFPSLSKDTFEKGDIGVGNPYSKGADKLVRFLYLHGFDSCQLGPSGQISEKLISPYKSGVFSKNKLFINLPELATSKYANILSKEDVESHMQLSKVDGENYNYADYVSAFKNIDEASDIAYNNFEKKLYGSNEDAMLLNMEFSRFKQKEMPWVLSESMFNVLAKKYGTDDFTKWDEKDANLIDGIKIKDENAIKRFQSIFDENEDEINKNCFIQFIAKKQISDWNNTHRNYAYINDLLVGFSNADLWANKDAFLSNMRLGCPSGGENGGAQYWNIPVLDPKKLFNRDGSLGLSGKLLKRKIESSVDGFSNVRIDHAKGLVDPFIYNKDNKYECGNMSNMSYYDPEHNFQKVLKNIVLPTLKDNGIDYKEAVWENLGDDSEAFNNIYYNELNIPGISQLAWERAENIHNSYNWSLIGSHDNEPAINMTEWNNQAWDKDYLAGFLNADPQHACRKQKVRSLLEDNHNLLRAKFAELFRSTKNIQISFADFFGIKKVYNNAGTENENNWKLRLNNDFEDTYYKSLEDKNSDALNMPETLKTAIIAKNDMIVARANDINTSRADLIRDEYQEDTEDLISRLDKYSKILKEKEN